jgi:hypothetical protein
MTRFFSSSAIGNKFSWIREATPQACPPLEGDTIEVSSRMSDKEYKKIYFTIGLNEKDFVIAYQK